MVCFALLCCSNIYHRICTLFCFTLFCCGYIMSHTIYLPIFPRNASQALGQSYDCSCTGDAILWSIYQYSPELLHWHWGNHMIAPVPVKQSWGILVKYFSKYIYIGEVTLNDMGKNNQFWTTTKHNKVRNVCTLLGMFCSHYTTYPGIYIYICIYVYIYITLPPYHTIVPWAHICFSCSSYNHEVYHHY